MYLYIFILNLYHIIFILYLSFKIVFLPVIQVINGGVSQVHIVLCVSDSEFLVESRSIFNCCPIGTLRLPYLHTWLFELIVPFTSTVPKSYSYSAGKYDYIIHII